MLMNLLNALTDLISCQHQAPCLNDQYRILLNVTLYLLDPIHTHMIYLNIANNILKPWVTAKLGLKKIKINIVEVNYSKCWQSTTSTIKPE